ncbi:MAG: thioesterase [Rhodobacteraceae bacterium]|nr:thioesterase [Paracoccaceae bacterium]
MSRVFLFEQTVLPGWIDYNGHMRDSYYGLVFSLAVDALQDEVGFDAAYRQRTGCTIYLPEDHKFYLREIRQGARVRAETWVLDCNAKRFHLHLRMLVAAKTAAVAEFMELHLRQHPEPGACPMPPGIAALLRAARATPEDISGLPHRARPMGLIG